MYPHGKGEPKTESSIWALTVPLSVSLPALESDLEKQIKIKIKIKICPVEAVTVPVAVPCWVTLLPLTPWCPAQHRPQPPKNKEKEGIVCLASPAEGISSKEFIPHCSSRLLLSSLKQQGPALGGGVLVMPNLDSSNALPVLGIFVPSVKIIFALSLQPQSSSHGASEGVVTPLTFPRRICSRF